MSSDSKTLTIADRLSRHPPFDRLQPELLERLAATVRIRYLEPGEVVFDEGDPVKPELYVVVNGAIEVTQASDEGRALIDICDEGDIFGVRPILADRPYGARTKAKDDTQLYVLAQEQLDELVRDAPEVGLFFAADFASDPPQSGNENRLEAVRALSQEHRAVTGSDLRRVEPVDDVLTCGSETTIRRAAAQMSARNVGSIVVVDAERRPVGIATDRDLRSKVVSQGRDVSEPISAIMSAPVLTIGDEPSMSSLIATMMKSRVHHLPVTEDGTDGTPVMGMVSEHDILKARGSHPTVILSEISTATDTLQLLTLRDQAEDLLQQYLEEEVGMSSVASIISEINDTLIRRAIELALSELSERGLEPPVPFCWLALGSEGREEQLLRTDQDNAILYADPGELADEAESYFVDLGTIVVEILVDAGFERCPGEIMASNPKWSQPLSSWKRLFTGWIRSPQETAILHTNIFFDFRPVYGERSLAAELKSHIFEAIKNERGFLPFFARSATKTPPPLSFFRNMIVERGGEHGKEFDIKLRAMTPLSDAARVLVYDLAIDMYGSTAKRWHSIGDSEPRLARLANEAAMAYEMLMRFRALEGLRRGTSGRFVAISELNKLERQTLRSTFSVVKDVQLMLTSRYRTDFLR